MVQASEGPRRRGARIAIGAAIIAGCTAAIAFNLARTRRAEINAPPLGRFVNVDGARLHYVDRGVGRPIVLLHGNGASIEDFETSGVMALGADRYRMIAFDRPGFGYSDRPRSRVWTPGAQADLIHGAFEELGIERPIIVGHSFGALVALALAIRHPEKIGGLVLVSGYYFPTPRPDVLVAIPTAIPLIGDMMANSLSPLLARALTPAIRTAIFSPLPAPGRTSRWPVEMALRPSQIRASAVDGALMIPAAHILRRHYAKLELPVEIVAGDGDLVVNTRSHAKRLHGVIPGSSCEIIAGQGHMPHHDRPQHIVAAIDRIASR